MGNYKQRSPTGIDFGTSLLFVLYVNDAPEIIKKYTTTLFADDASVIVRTDKDNTEDEIGETLETLNEYFISNNLVENVDKTTIVNYNPTNKQNINQINIQRGNIKLTETHKSKFLGVTIDKKPNFRSHVDDLVKKLNSYTYAIKTISKHVNKKAGIVAYYGYIFSNINYGIIYWGTSNDIDRVFRSQKAAVRAIFGLTSRESCRETFTNNKIMTVPSIYIFQCILFIQKYYEDFFKSAETNHRYKTRGSERKTLTTLKTKYSYIQNSPTQKMISVYNKHLRLTRDKNIPNLKMYLKDFLTKHCLYAITDYMSLREEQQISNQ
uniref:Reverse transcriptase domain-containing protein n=1 Tax=Cacopsylla melanoneura TaxID=428564 RepID=A0A8D8Z5D2_9HEMI